MAELKREIGIFGEKVASKYLINKGYEILYRNYKKKFGEIDIIVRSKEGILIFCEVKTMREKPGFPACLIPEDNVTSQKAQKMRRAAQFFASKYPDLIYEEKGWQIDLLAIVLDSEDKAVKQIRHYENIL